MSETITKALLPPETETVLQQMWSGRSLIIIQGPPGSGRTSIALQCAALASLDGPVLLVAPDATRASDLSSRLRSLFPRLSVTDLDEILGVAVCSVDDLLVPGVNFHEIRPWMIVDDADHLSDSTFALISPLASRFVLISSSEILRRPFHESSGDDFFDVEPCSTTALLERPWVNPWTLELSRSYRLPKDTVEALLPAFSSTPFKATTSFPSRSLDLPPIFDLNKDVDRALSLASSGVSLVGCELPLMQPGRLDHSGMLAIRDLFFRLTRGGVRMILGGMERDVLSGDVLVIAPDGLHASFVSSLIGEGEAVVTTPEKAIGDHPFVLVLDRAGGYSDHVRARSLVQSCTVHQVACFVVHRGIVPGPPRLSFAPMSWGDVHMSSRVFLEHLGMDLCSARRRVRIQDRA